MLNLGETFPNFDCVTTKGNINLYEYFGNDWGLFLSHPADFTPVCTTEIGRLAQLQKDFAKRNVKIILLSCDTIEDHNVWVEDVVKYSGCKVPFPLIGDKDGEIANRIGMLDKGADKIQTVRGVFVIGPDKKVKGVISYPASTGRNMDELLRLIDSLQLTATNSRIVTPADWTAGGDVLVKPGEYIKGAVKVDLPSGQEYMKFVNLNYAK